MGTSFVNISKRGFWIRDSMLELWLRLAALHIDEATSAVAPNKEIRDQWLLASIGCFGGCVPDGIEKSVSSPEGKAVVVDAIQSLSKVLSACPERIEPAFLNLLGIDEPFVGPVETWRLLEVSAAMVDLIEGRITTDASRIDFMPGCGERRPNQALLPTSTVVTPAADAPVAPTAAAADL